MCFPEGETEVLHVARAAVEEHRIVKFLTIIRIFRRVYFHVEAALSRDCRHAFGRFNAVFNADVVFVCEQFFEQCAAASDGKDLA